MTSAQVLDLLPKLGERWAEEVALKLNVSTSTVRHWKRSRRVPATRASHLAVFLHYSGLSERDVGDLTLFLLDRPRRRKRA